MRKLTDYLLLGAKGFGMGAADVVPGVSGGTIAFITGIYEELIDSIKGIDLGVLKVLRKDGLVAAWNHINGNFLLSVFAGIIVSVFSLAKLLSYLLDNYPVMLWAFFFGLIVASAIFVARQVKQWNAGTIVALLAGGAFAFFITTLTRVDTPHEWWFIFLSGAIAICAMILPGISGSFILVILGQYDFVLKAVKGMDIKVIISFALGALIGLLSFSRLVSWLFKHYHDHTIAVLTGFMIGSLNKVWPWKVTTGMLSEKHALEENVLPGDYTTVTGMENYMVPAIGLVIGGFAVVWILERLAVKPEQ